MYRYGELIRSRIIPYRYLYLYLQLTLLLGPDLERARRRRWRILRYPSCHQLTPSNDPLRTLSRSLHPSNRR